MCSGVVQQLYKLLLIYYAITTFRFVDSLNNVNSYRTSFESPATNVIMHDMQAAFNPVTKNTNITENVVSRMYNFKVSNHPNMMNSAMVFKLPFLKDSNDDNSNTERVVLMERQQFMEPTFPNLTKSYMTLRRFKFSKSPINLNITELMKQEMSSIYQESTSNSWSHLGLNGWNGDIAEEDHTYNTLSDYPNLQIIKDLHGGLATTEYIKDVTADQFQKKKQHEALMHQLDKNVFIARANDPFGYSTKWQMRKSNQTKHKRDVLRLYSMIKCSTGCEPLIYKGYGCYCGFLGHGIPTDGIDRCCKLHDKCYEQSNCISYLEYFVPYVWKCYRGKPLCAIDHGEWGGPESCAARLCYCDLRLSRCLKQFACPKRRAVCKSSVSRRLQNILLVK